MQAALIPSDRARQVGAVNAACRRPPTRRRGRPALRLATVIAMAVAGLALGVATPASATPPASEPTFVAAGNEHTCGLTIRRGILCWGSSSFGATTVTPGHSFRQVVAEGNYSCGLTTQTGAPVCWGSSTTVSLLSTLPPGTVFAQMQGGPFHACGVTPARSVMCWGSGGFNQTTVPSGLSLTAAVTAGGTHSCALSTTGAVRCWGRGDLGQTSPPGGVTFVQISAGSFHTCGVTTDGIRCWGQNTFGQAPPVTLGSFAQVTAGAAHTCALTTGGQAVCWGAVGSIFGEAVAPAAELFDEISAGGNQTCGLTQAGNRIVCWGRNTSGQANVPAGRQFGPPRLGVTTTGDVVAYDGACSLREAIINANTESEAGSTDCAPGSGADTIEFDIPGGGVHTISPLSQLPDITEALVIDGYTQPGAVANTAVVGSNAGLRIELRGNPANNSFGLSVRARGSVVRGLVVNGFDNGTFGAAIQVYTEGSNARIEGNFLGTDATGAAVAPVRNRFGIAWLDSSIPNDKTGVIGGTGRAARNVISGNSLNGVNLDGSAPTVVGNVIGTNAAGTAAVPNLNGVGVGRVLSTGDSDAAIGGPAVGSGNLISGNSTCGIRSAYAGAPTNDVTILGNLIGTDGTGTAAIGNQYGVCLINNAITPDVQIGDGTVGGRNVVSGNTAAGISVTGAASILGNHIGTTATGVDPLPNATGVLVSPWGPVRIGDGTPGGGNVVSGNTTDGIAVNVPAVGQVTIKGNLIGVGSDGTTPLGNAPAGGAGAGVTIVDNDNVVVGGRAPGDGNVIAHNGRGIQVLAGAGNAVVGNNIRDNVGLGIDLGGDGVTFNHAGTSVGPNGYQNFPLLDVVAAEPSSVRAKGTIDGIAGSTVAIDLYRGARCNASNFGDGVDYLGRLASPVLFGPSAGRRTFDAEIPTIGDVEGSFITATATDLGPTGGTSEFSFCQLATTTNLNWANATPITPGAIAGAGPVVSQKITMPNQEKWFKFPVQPGAKVRVHLTAQPGNALSLHRDPHPIYNGLINPSSAAVLSAEAADFAFLPSGTLPSGTLPSGTLPSGTLPSGTLPSGTLPSGWLPSGTLPSGTLPSGTLPSGTLPSGTLPSGTLPSGTLPSGTLPSGTLPSGTLPSGSTDAYGTAARRSLLAASMDPYATVKTIERNSYDLQEDLYVRVVGPPSLADSFMLEVTVSGGACAAVQPVATGLPTILGTQPSNTARASLIVTDSARLAGTPADKAIALADLETLAARGDVTGVVIDLQDLAYPRVAAANAQADTNPGCPIAKNLVATEIKRVLDVYRAANTSAGATTVQYVVLAGGADVIPFYQVQDVAGLANENEHVPPVRPNTPSEAGLKSGLVKGQDFYGSSINLNVGSRPLAVPDLAVGRLVDDAADVSAVVNAYIATDGVVVPSSSLVTGYDFVGDAAEIVRSELNAGTASTADTLIQSPGEAPTAPSAWTASQLRTKVLAGGHDVMMLSGHFSAGSLLAADYATTMTASEVQSSTTDLRKTIVLALGCHGGFALPSSDLLAGASPNPDWAKAFLRKGSAGFVAATGYAYGDTELVEYGERLFVGLTRQLRTGSGPVALGQALVDAKRGYLASTAQVTGIDEKTIVEMTLYGLPMMKVDLPGARMSTPVTPPLVAAAAPVATGPGAGLGLSSTVAVLHPAVITTTKTLANLATGGTVITSYRSGRDGVVANPFEPILPKQMDDVTVPGQVLRGVALRGANYTDVDAITPLTAAPATETSRPHGSFTTEVFYPNQPYMSNFYDAVDGGRTRLVTVPSQFRSTAPGATDGTVRTFDRLDLAFYYLPDTWTSLASATTTKAAAVGPAVNITGVSATVDTVGTAVTFNVNALADGSAGVQAVWVLYTGTPGSLFHGTWAPVDLTRNPADPTTWTGSLPLNGASGVDLRFMVTAVNGSGLTSLATNLGAYYAVGQAVSGVALAQTTVTLLAPPSSAPYLTNTTFAAELRAGSMPLAGRSVVFDVGGQRVLGVTTADGRATATLAPVMNPGAGTLQVTYRGETGYLASTTASPITVTRVATNVTITPATITVAFGQPTGIVATLRNAAGQALGGKPITFVLTSGAETAVRSVKADLWGAARLADASLPAGTYAVTAHFSGSIPVGGGETLEQTDVAYDSSSSTSMTLTVTGVVTPPTVAATVSPGPAPSGWHRAAPIVSIVGTAGFAPVASVSYAVGAAAYTTSAGASTAFAVVAEGTTTVQYYATDSQGRVSASGSTTVRLDTIAPTIDCPAAPTFLLNQPGAVLSAAVSDGGSGPTTASVSATVPTGVASAVTVSVTGTDVAGNATTGACTANVTYRVSGFEQPIDMGGVLNTANSGQTIAVKWTLTDFGNVPVSDPTSFVSLTTSAVACEATAPTDEVEAFSTASGLQYLGAGRWQFNWKSVKGQTGCSVLLLNLRGAPGALTARFKFR